MTCVPCWDIPDVALHGAIPTLGAMDQSGPDLALLLLATYRKLVDRAVLDLEQRGYHDVTPALHFAMTAISLGADSASTLAEALAVTKQAAAKTVAALASREWVHVSVDPTDSRRKRLVVTPLGNAVMTEGAAAFDRLRRSWADAAGEAALGQLEQTLRDFVGADSIRLDAPGWGRDV